MVFRAPAKEFTKALNPNAMAQRQVNKGGKDDDDGDDPLKEIDDAIDQLCGSKSLHGGEIVRQYQPSRMWLWSQWHGTILQHNVRTTLMAMLFSLVFFLMVRAFAEPTWAVGLAPDEDHPLIERLSMIKRVWVRSKAFLGAEATCPH